MKLGILDKGNKLVHVMEVLPGMLDDEFTLRGRSARRNGRLVKAHIAPSDVYGESESESESESGSTGRMMILVVHWSGYHDVANHYATYEPIRQWHPPKMAVYEGVCEKVVTGARSEGSLWHVVQLIEYEGSGKVAASVRHFTSLVTTSLVGAGSGE